MGIHKSRLLDGARLVGLRRDLVSVSPVARRRFADAELSARLGAAKRNREEAIAVLKQLGGRARTADEERQFRDALLTDPGLSTQYFEKRLWERSAA